MLLSFCRQKPSQPLAAPSPKKTTPVIQIAVAVRTSNGMMNFKNQDPPVNLQEAEVYGH